MQAIIADGLQQVVGTSDGRTGIEDLELGGDQPHLGDRSRRTVTGEKEVKDARCILRILEVIKIELIQRIVAGGGGRIEAARQIDDT